MQPDLIDLLVLVCIAILVVLLVCTVRKMRAEERIAAIGIQSQQALIKLLVEKGVIGPESAADPASVPPAMPAHPQAPLTLEQIEERLVRFRKVTLHICNR